MYHILIPAAGFFLGFLAMHLRHKYILKKCELHILSLIISKCELHILSLIISNGRAMTSNIIFKKCVDEGFSASMVANCLFNLESKLYLRSEKRENTNEQ